MTEKVRVTNVTPYNIGLKAQNGIEYNIKPHLFVTMNREDVEYNMAIAPRLFSSPAQLIVSDEELNSMMGIDAEKANVCDSATIEKALKGTAAKLKTWLAENKQPHVLESVYEVAMKMDLPASKIKVLQEFMPLREFIEE